MSRIESVNIWLVTRCGGLIEANKPSNLEDTNRNLSYLHRTVRDFLELPQIWTRIIGPTRGSDFIPHVSLLQSSILFSKLALRPDIDSYEILCFADIGLRHAYQAEFETHRPQVFLLDELDRLIQDTSRLNEPYLNTATYDNFLALAIRNGLYHYVAHKIEYRPDVVRRFPGRPLLAYAVGDSRRTVDVGEFNLSSKMVDLLMQNGADPNQIYGGQSAWDCILRMFASNSFDSADDIIPSELLRIVQIFIENDALVNKKIYQKITKVLESKFPEETKRLQDLMVAKGALRDENRSSTTTIPLERKRKR
jgi:hypothetical protein